MQHFLNLEKCTCGAYRYLAVREHKKSYEIYLIHHRHFSTGQNVRKYSKLASIPKFKIDIHYQRIDEENKEKVVRLNREQISSLRSILRQLDFKTVTVEEAKSLGDITENVDPVPSDIVEDSELIGASLP